MQMGTIGTARNCGRTVLSALRANENGAKVHHQRRVRRWHNPKNTGEMRVASNEPTGDGRRIGAVKKRTQLKTKIMGEEHYTKRDKTTGQFLNQKADDKKFKGVRKER